MKQIKLVLALLVLIIPILFIPARTTATANNIDQVCSNRTSDYTFLSHSPTQVFVPTSDNIDLALAYIKVEIGTEAIVKAEIISGVTGNIITSNSVTAYSQAQWIYFHFPNVPLPPNEYFGLKLTNLTPGASVVWYHGINDCYSRGFAVYDGQGHIEFDYTFATYYYIAESAPAEEPASDPSPDAIDPEGVTSNSTGTSEEIQTIDKSLSKNSFVSDQEAFNKEVEDLREALANGELDDKSPSSLNWLWFYGIRLLPFIIFGGLLFLIIVVSIIILVRRGKNKSVAQKAPEVTKTAEVKNADASTSKVAPTISNKTDAPPKKSGKGFGVACIVIAIIVFVGLIVLGVGGYFGYKYLKNYMDPNKNIQEVQDIYK